MPVGKSDLGKDCVDGGDDKALSTTNHDPCEDNWACLAGICGGQNGGCGPEAEGEGQRSLTTPSLRCPASWNLGQTGLINGLLLCPLESLHIPLTLCIYESERNMK